MEAMCPLQLNNKIRHCRKILQHSSQIFSTHELRQKVCEKLEVPESDVEGYVAHFKIDDEDDEKEPRFTIIWSTKKTSSSGRGELIFPPG